jgi:hypothetical protein
LVAREPYFFGRWVDDEWGRVGGRFLAERLGGAAAYLTACGGYEAAQAAFGPAITEHLAGA